LFYAPATPFIYPLSLHDALPIFVQVPGMQYLVFDYLAEMTLSSFAQTRAANPQAGYAMEFVDTLREILPACAERGIKLVSNGGRSEEHTSELQSRENIVCRLLLE